MADYEKMAQASEFGNGLDRIIEGAKKYRVALMCSERDPLDCHRCLLVGRALAQRGVRVNHILDDGNVVSHAEIEDKLLELSGRSTDDFLLHVKIDLQQHIANARGRLRLWNHSQVPAAR
jgi:uncharacterized protein (DUF488 family)